MIGFSSQIFLFFFGRGGGNKKQRQEKAIMEQVKN